MKATLATITTAAGMTAEEIIAHEARVSNPSNQDNHATALGLLRYCMVHSHWSPFDMVDLTLEIETTRAIMAQVARHWSFRFQEFSLRYASVTSEFEPVEMRMKHKGGNRQGSAGVDDAITMQAQELIACSGDHYHAFIEAGVAPECARMVLPLATPTRAYMKGSVRSWITYFWQRIDGHAQKEHRQLASAMFNIFEEQFPNIAQLVLAGKAFYVETAKIRELLDKIHGIPGLEDSVEYLETLLWKPVVNE